GVGHGDPRVERGELLMLLVLLRAVVTACEREDERVIALQRAELARRRSVIGQLVVGKHGAGHHVGTHGLPPSSWRCRQPAESARFSPSTSSFRPRALWCGSTSRGSDPHEARDLLAGTDSDDDRAL